MSRRKRCIRRQTKPPKSRTRAKGCAGNQLFVISAFSPTGAVIKQCAKNRGAAFTSKGEGKFMINNVGSCKSVCTNEVDVGF